MLGICRGLQLLNGLNGGSLYQDMDGHRSAHSVFYKIDGQIGYLENVPSTHHQCVRSIPIDAHVVMRAKSSGHREYMSQNEEVIISKGPQSDVEGVYYEKTKALGIQSHPEYVSRSSEFRDVFWKMLEHYCFKQF